MGDGNRTTVRRKEDSNRLFLVDQYSPLFFATVVAILFLCVTDSILTLSLLYQGVYETNPLMAYLLNISPRAFFIFKYGLTIIATCVLYIFNGVAIRKFNLSTHSFLYLVAWLYVAVVGWELYLVYKFT